MRSTQTLNWPSLPAVTNIGVVFSDSSVPRKHTAVMESSCGMFILVFRVKLEEGYFHEVSEFKGSKLYGGSRSKYLFLSSHSKKNKEVVSASTLFIFALSPMCMYPIVLHSLGIHYCILPSIKNPTCMVFYHVILFYKFQWNKLSGTGVGFGGQNLQQSDCYICLIRHRQRWHPITPRASYVNLFQKKKSSLWHIRAYTILNLLVFYSATNVVLPKVCRGIVAHFPTKFCQHGMLYLRQQL